MQSIICHGFGESRRENYVDKVIEQLERWDKLILLRRSGIS